MLHRTTVSTYERAGLQLCFREMLDGHGGFDALAERGRRVLLKPNFVMPGPADDASTTQPNFYMALAITLQEAGFEVGIGESPAFGSCAGALKAHGVLNECITRGITVVEFARSVPITGVEGSGRYETLSIAAELSEWDSLINVPKLKTHRQFVFTGAIKNLYGCVVGRRKFWRHNQCANDPVRFARMLHANAAALAPTLHIADGISALHVNGPRGGEPYPLNTILYGDDAALLDWYFAAAIGLHPASTPLFQALPSDARAEIRRAFEAQWPSLEPARDFVHAPLIHISFSPLAVMRSLGRSVRQKLRERKAG
ncbi:MAG: DUF362 domain-containing protein [Pseudomonadota bacterium]